MGFHDNMIFIPNPLQTSANSLAEEATSTGKVEYVAPCNLDIQGFGVLVAVTLGNTITTATGFVLAKVDAAAAETVLDRLVLCNNSNGLYAGDGDVRGGTVAAATTVALAAGSIVYKKLTDSRAIKAGEIIRLRGSTTAGSATGDVVPFVIARVAGEGFEGTNVYVEGGFTRQQNT